MTTKNKGGRPKNAVVVELEERLGVSARRVRQLITEFGIDRITDIEQLRVEEKRILIALRGLRAQREEHDLELARRDVIPKSEAFEYGCKLGEIANRLCDEALTNWPTALAGKSELQIRETLGQILGEFVHELREAAKAI
jgi:hypothetical protein